MALDSNQIRQVFLDFFASKEHKVVPSAPMVVKDDPTLMFTNAGMNQFKDFFLGNKKPTALRIADTQKCLRVSGKHNDLEEVGRDGYHHTMFEMLGNWSFGDYFKQEAIAWAWELLVDTYGLDKDRIYVTVFGGDDKESLAPDEEARQHWNTWIANERILDFGKKDNFWEMGDTGPCGPCSEIHYDLRPDSEREKIQGAELVNQGSPEVVELWNLVFIQFNRKGDGSLENLPQRHVDTGMGFERLTRALQHTGSNYDTDIFLPFIQFIAQATGIEYTGDYAGKSDSDIAMRVLADHVRALFFGIADGQLPSNTGAGYVLRRILRRAVRYYYSFLNVKEPLAYRLVPLLAEYFAGSFPDAVGQREFISQVIHEEEQSFLRTLDAGMRRFDSLNTSKGVISGEDAFELYDTYGFPFDLTQLMAAEQGLQVDQKAFEQALSRQKKRSKEDAQRTLSDWVVLSAGDTSFVGYDQSAVDAVRILKYREVTVKGSVQYHLVLDKTPFYPEGGGQVGDTGTLSTNTGVVHVIDTIKENDLPIVITSELPADPGVVFRAQIDQQKRRRTEYNHSATHLLHAALRKTLGKHVQQKGSLVTDTYLRFDFSHFHKMTNEEIHAVEHLVNEKIRAAIPRGEDRAVPIEQAKEAGAMMLFGEKYGDTVRMITFDPDYSVELCGGCHVDNTAHIGLFKILSESAIAAGVRRIEAVTATAAEQFIDEQLAQLDQLSETLKRPADILAAVQGLVDDNKHLRKRIEEMQKDQVGSLVPDLIAHAEHIGQVHFIAHETDLSDGKALKDLVFRLTSQLDNAVVLIGAAKDDKVQMHVGLSKPLAEGGTLDATKIVQQIAGFIHGGGGGQPFYASAGGSNPQGITHAFEKAKEIVRNAAGVLK